MLQFTADELTDFDSLVSFEDRLFAHLRNLAKVDGHDFGSGEFNIFLYTDQPSEVFNAVEELRRLELPDYIPTVAYREVSGDEYVVLSNPVSKEFRIT